MHACHLLALGSVLLAVTAEAQEPAPPTTSLAWGDLDGDGRADVHVRTHGAPDRLLRNAGNGSFEDVTALVLPWTGRTSRVALWQDVDGDERLDLILVSAASELLLLHNHGGVLIDATGVTGIVHEAPVTAVQVVDLDGDELPDLELATAAGPRVLRNLGSVAFEEVVLDAGVGSAPDATREGVDRTGEPILPNIDGALVAETGEAAQAGKAGGGVAPIGGRSGIGPLPTTPWRGPPEPERDADAISVTPVGATGPLTCAQSVEDQAGPGCLLASSTPTLGELYPMSANLNVHASTGNVGIGTTLPMARLEVAGTARMSDTLTLAPSGDEALDVASGSVYKAGALFLHTKGGIRSTALGEDALASTTGYSNTAVGYRALSSTTSGGENTACGTRTLSANTTGGQNTASGSYALRNNTSGGGNTAVGFQTLFFNTTGVSNTAIGRQSMLFNTGGNNNTATGQWALFKNKYGYENTASGFQALYSNTYGFKNTGLGSKALYASTTGSRNTAVGSRALYSNEDGTANTASGESALFSNTYGASNTAAGSRALYSNTSGQRNTANGSFALADNLTGYNNTACGYGALDSNTASRNTAAGSNALQKNTTGARNVAMGSRALRENTSGSGSIAVGYKAGFNLTTGSDNIALGHQGVAGEGGTIRIGTPSTHTRAFVAGVRGTTTGNANAIPVLVDSAGQLGTVSSSRRFKQDIRDMDEVTERLLELRPVVFRYKPEVQEGERPLEYGLIAEEVAEVFPELVVYDEEGQPFTVKYHLLSSMLLNELQQLSAREERLEGRLEALEALEATEP